MNNYSNRRKNLRFLLCLNEIHTVRRGVCVIHHVFHRTIVHTRIHIINYSLNVYFGNSYGEKLGFHHSSQNNYGKLGQSHSSLNP